MDADVPQRETGIGLNGEAVLTIPLAIAIVRHMNKFLFQNPPSRPLGLRLQDLLLLPA